MKNVNETVFLNKIYEKIKNGEYDEYMTIPFMSRNLFYSSLKTKLNKKISSGGSPILNDSEIKDCLNEIKETAVYIVWIFLKLGFIEKDGENFKFTDKGNQALKTSFKMSL